MQCWQLTVQLSANAACVQAADAAGQCPDGRGRVGRGGAVAALQCVHDRGGPGRMCAHLGAGGTEHQLRVRGCTVVLDPEDAEALALLAQLHALVVPECRRRGDAAGEQVRHGVIADRERVNLRGAHAGTDQDRVQHRQVTRIAGDANGLAGEVTRAAEARGGDHRGQRSLHDRHQANELATARVSDREVVNVEDREVDAPGVKNVDRVGALTGHDDVQVNAGCTVVAACQRRVDAGVDRVRREVEHQRRVAHGADGGCATGVGPAAAGDPDDERERDEEGRDQLGRRPDRAV